MKKRGIKKSEYRIASLGGNLARRMRHILLFSMIFFAIFGCRQQQQPQPDAWKWKWPAWGKTQPATTQNTTPGEPKTPAVVSNFFNVRILESTGTDHQLNEAWSYLDEAAPVSGDWQLLHRNGLRCGIGQYSDWPAIKQQLEKCGTRMKTDLQVSLSSFAPMNILSDQMKSERTLFYYDCNGRTHGRDFGASTLQFTMTMAGRMAGGRVRAVFSPKIIRPISQLEQITGKENRKSTIEQELENFSIIVDLGPEEFAIIGPSGREMADSLVGSQLFLGWNQGQRRSTFILISTAQLEDKKNNSQK
jgi:hypothetical protein